MASGYFGIGVDSIANPINFGTVARAAHAFGASFMFTINSQIKIDGRSTQSDTTFALRHLPYYDFKNINQLHMPEFCALVGVEIVDDAIQLPRFKHPHIAMYVMGAERSGISKPVLKKCDFVVQIPTQICINLGVAGSIVMYDRFLSMKHYHRELPPADSCELRKQGLISPNIAESVFNMPKSKREKVDIDLIKNFDK